MKLGPLYHWSPVTRRKGITRHGLLPGKPPSVGTVCTVTDGRFMVCLGVDPALAWSLSGAMRHAPPGVWDLYQVTLAPDDEVHVLPHWGPFITEVRVANRISKSRVIWLAQRGES